MEATFHKSTTFWPKKLLKVHSETGEIDATFALCISSFSVSSVRQKNMGRNIHSASHPYEIHQDVPGWFLSKELLDRRDLTPSTTWAFLQFLPMVPSSRHDPKNPPRENPRPEVKAVGILLGEPCSSWEEGRKMLSDKEPRQKVGANHQGPPTWGKHTPLRPWGNHPLPEIYLKTKNECPLKKLYLLDDDRRYTSGLFYRVFWPLFKRRHSFLFSGCKF